MEDKIDLLEEEIIELKYQLKKAKEKELIYKFIPRDKIFGRALGYGGAEELFEPQVWTNYDTIRIKGLLDAPP